MDGIHLLGEWYGCPADTPEFTRAEPLRDLCVERGARRRAHVVGERFFQFEPQGVTGTVLLAESHLAIHTWPEAGFVTVDVYVCNSRPTTRRRPSRCSARSKPRCGRARTRFQAIHRGGKDA